MRHLQGTRRGCKCSKSDWLHALPQIHSIIFSQHDGKGRPHLLISSLCYCLVSRFPFFPLHQDVIHSALAILHSARLEQLSKHHGGHTAAGSAAGAGSLMQQLRSGPLALHQVDACMQLLQR